MLKFLLKCVSEKNIFAGTLLDFTYLLNYCVKNVNIDVKVNVDLLSNKYWASLLFLHHDSVTLQVLKVYKQEFIADVHF